MRPLWLLMLAVCLSGVQRIAWADPTISLHLVPADFQADCATVDADSLDCSTVDAVGDSSSMQFAFVLATGVESISALQFGVVYDSTVSVLFWSDCTDGIEVSEPSWPASGTGNLIGFDPVEPTNTDSLVVIGYFGLAQGSYGRLGIVDDPRIGEVNYVDGDGFTYTIPHLLLGIVDASGEDSGDYVPCGLEVAAPSDSVLVMFGPDIVDFTIGRHAGSIGQANISSTAIESLLVEHDVQEIESLAPGSEADTVGVARTGEEVRLIGWSSMFWLRLGAGGDAQALIDDLVLEEETAFAELPDTASTPLTPVYPNDPLFASNPADTLDRQWNLSITNSADDDRYDPSIDVDIDAPEAWTYSQGEGVLVVNLDTGFYDGITVHEDLVGQVDERSDASPPGSAHGTKTASVIAAATDNAIGMAGVAPKAKLFDRRASSFGAPSDTLFDQTKSIGADIGTIQVIRGCSIGLRLLWRNVYMLSGVMVSAMSNTPTPGCTWCPMHFGQEDGENGPGQPGLINVGAYCPSGSLWEGSCTGPEIDLVAPGCGVWVANRPDLSQNPALYVKNDGTSLSAPHVAGAAALLLAHSPDLYADDVENLLRVSADDLGTMGFDDDTGAGRLNAWAALVLLRDPPYELVHSEATGADSVTSVTTESDVDVYGAHLTDGSTVDLRRTTVRKNLDFSQDYNPVHVWARGGAALSDSGVVSGYAPTEGSNWFSSTTYLLSVPWCDVVAWSDSTLTLETHLYEYWDGQAWDPLVPLDQDLDDISFAYTVVRIPDESLTPVEEDGPADLVRPTLSIVGARPVQGTPATFAVSIPRRMRVKINVYDIGGRLVRRVHDGDLLRGGYRLQWDGDTNGGARVAPGLYFVKMVAGSNVTTERLLLLR